MRTNTLTVLLVCLCLAFSGMAFAHEPSRGALDQVTRAIHEAMSGECPKNPIPVSGDRVEELLQKLQSEELSLGQAKELIRLTHNFECGLSPEAQPAATAFKQELIARSLDPISIMQGDVDLVTPALLPESWNHLLAEAGHEVDTKKAGLEKADPIILGCVAAMGFMTQGMLCSNDGFEAWEDCINNRLCSEGVSVDQKCCDEKLDSDLWNCYLSGGFNVPDGDYANCC